MLGGIIHLPPTSRVTADDRKTAKPANFTPPPPHHQYDSPPHFASLPTKP